MATITSLAGLDATVFVPVVDFKFTNDTPYWLLMETYVSASNGTLTWKFYSTSDGRTVEWQTSGPLNMVEPPEAVCTRKTRAVQGHDQAGGLGSRWGRCAGEPHGMRDGNVLSDDIFATHYLPWQAVYQYGPGTEDIPTPEPDENSYTRAVTKISRKLGE